MAPWHISEIAGTIPYYLVFLGLGFAFGFVLELAGFGDSRKLAGQFYLREMTVLKVMFTGIVVAAGLVLLASSVGLLDFDRVFVPPTFLAPGIIGGLIMGVGFIVGGFCPGTSVVAASTLKLDGVMFLLGVVLGIGVFNETFSADSLTQFWYSTSFGRMTLDEVFGIPIGVVFLLLAVMAIVMFYGAELSEAFFGRRVAASEMKYKPSNKFYMAGAGMLVALGLFLTVNGQPSPDEKYMKAALASGVTVDNRDPYVSPAEVVEWLWDTSVYVTVIDIRTESDFNDFNIYGSKRVDIKELESEPFVRQLKALPENSIVFLVSNGERMATDAYRILVGRGVANVYIIEGGINNWLSIYPPASEVAKRLPEIPEDEERLRYVFERSVGSGCYAAHPDGGFVEPPLGGKAEMVNGGRLARPNPLSGVAVPPHEKKVKVKKKAGVSGGCG